MPAAREHYELRRQTLSRELSALDARYNLISWSRLATLPLAVGLPLASVWMRIGALGWAVAATCAVAFALLVALHMRVASIRQRASAAHSFVERAISRLEGKWASFPEQGKAFHRDDHPYALDLDLFGQGSLFQLLNDARTALGQQRLAKWLSEPADSATIHARQAAIQELSRRHELREAIAVAGAGIADASPDPQPFVAWASGPQGLRASPALRALMWLLPAACVASAIAATRFPPLVWAFAAAFITNLVLLARLGPRLQPAISAASRRSGDLERFARMMLLVESQSFDAPALCAIQQRLRASGASASIEIARLARLVSTLEARENGAFRATVGPALLWDLHCVAAIERWQVRVGPHVRDWLDALGDFEASCSVGSFAFERPAYAWPVVDEEALHFLAEGLGHPLLEPDRMVVNDVALPEPACALLVTGSNMSGKSTLLRSIGAAAVLAMAGAPVCATRLRMSVCAVRTSMRISDSVREGVSRFYAEILKIKGVVDTTNQARPVLFLLDEILHGTNSRERHIGALSVLRALLEKGAVGAVSTHDLALADLTSLQVGKVRTVHFQEQVVDDKMTFDYRLRDGLVRSGNALRWMRIVGLPVLEADAENR